MLLLLAAALPALAQTEEQPTGTITVDDSAEKDAAIAVRIREILSELDGFDDVTVTVSSGIVTLRGTALDAASVGRLNEIAGRVEGVVAIENEVSETTDVVRRLNPAVERFMGRMTQIVAFLPLAAVALTAFLAVVFLGYLAARMRWPWNKIAPNAFIADILRTIVQLAFVVGGLVVALDILGATALLSTILGAAGIVGLAIGFAVKDTVENFIASIMLSIRQPFRPNDTIEIGGDLGKVIRLTSRATILLSFDGNHIRIPNSTVFKSRIVNYSTNDERRFLFDVGVAPDSDLARAVQIARETLEALPFVLPTPAPNVWVEAIGDSTIAIRLTAWIAQHETSFVAARGEAIRKVTGALGAAGIAMPEPTYRLLTPLAPPAGAAASAPAPAPQPAAAASGEALDVEARMDQELEAIVEGERAETSADDLLTEAAPKE
ncbi:mechanosensitive ion channel domain-containing protein [Primorskyibacter sp. S187A]|uniref:mechanosensitive ion channel domain-containing protein n=1 Tax=Primorskyibacter sp. S187A TaxID=3415130 RepID=UPI003C7C5619